MLSLQRDDEHRDHNPEPVRDNVTPLHRADDDERAWSRSFEAATDAAALIPEGEYHARVATPPKVYRLLQSDRLVLQFAIVEPSRYAGTLVAFYTEVRTGQHARFREAWTRTRAG